MRPHARSALKIEARFDSLSAIRRFAHEALARLGCREDHADSLVHALDEAATNAVEHGYKGTPGELEITVERNGTELAVRLRDWAPAFDPTGHPPPDLSLPLHARPTGGLGIHLMRSLADEVRYRSVPGGGNEVTLVKWMEAQEGEGAS